MADLDLAGIITRVCADLKLRFASISHQHTIYDLPIGSTSTTVPLGNHTHSGYASSSHSHGSISSTGTIGSDTTVASGDKLVIIDASSNNAVKRSGIAFGTSTSTFLRNDGTWAETLEGDSAFPVVADNITIGTVPSEIQYGKIGGFEDSQGTTVGYLHIQYTANDKVIMAMGAKREISGSDVYSTLKLSIDSGGTKRFEVDGNATLGGTLNVTGDATIGGELDLTTDDKHISMHDSRLDASYGGVPSMGANVSRVVRMMDSDDRQVSRLLLRQAADGRRMASFESHGYDANGNDVWNRLGSIVTANGERTYDVGDPAAFCEVLHVGDYVTNSATNVSTATSVYKDLFNFTLAAGTWMVFANLEFAANGTGRRVAALNTTAGGSGISVQWRATEAALSGAVTRVRVTGVLTPSASTKYYLTSWQNSGGNLSVTAVVQAVRIR